MRTSPSPRPTPAGVPVGSTTTTWRKHEEQEQTRRPRSRRRGDRLAQPGDRRLRWQLDRRGHQGQRGAGRRAGRLRRPEHGGQPLGRLRGRRLRRRHHRPGELGCKVNYKELKEDVAWQGFGTGEVDVVIEDWGHPDLEKQFFEDSGDGSAMDMGPTGNVGIIGWYVPPWLAEEHPEILDYENLNDFASEFATSETGSKGQFLGADPSYVQFDESIIATSTWTSRSSSPAARPPASPRSSRPRRTRSS